MKVALVHDWLTGMRGGEKCLEIFCEIFPEADLYTLVYAPDRMSDTINRMKIRTSILQKIPGVLNTYRCFLPVMPFAIESFNLKDYDLVLSSSHCVAKGVKIKNNAKHICYCFTPMRYIWDLYNDYSKEASPIAGLALKVFLNYLRKWDLASSAKVDEFIAISQYIQERIQRVYKRDSVVIYPPVDTDKYHFGTNDSKSDYYLLVGAFASYKRVDLAVDTFNRNGKKLLVIGNGQEFEKIIKTAKSNIKFLGWVDDDLLRKYYAQARALIFPSNEDFGIVPLEAMACGTPVIAYAKGGALETVVDAKTGVYFHSQTPESLDAAIISFESLKFDTQELRDHALKFSTQRFKSDMRKFLFAQQ